MKHYIVIVLSVPILPYIGFKCGDIKEEVCCHCVFYSNVFIGEVLMKTIGCVVLYEYSTEELHVAA